MSRIGKQPVEVPKGVTCTVQGNEVTVQGPKGKLSYSYAYGISVAVEGNVVNVSKQSDTRQARADYGTTRAHINNMVKGVTEGFRRGVELHGVGYTAKLAGRVLTLKVGYSHEVNVEVPESVTCTITGTKIAFESYDKEAVGHIASKVRKVKPPEPYLGVGIRYEGEVVRRKAGKTGKK